MARDEKTDQAIALFEAGWSNRQIANELDLTMYAVQSRRKRWKAQNPQAAEIKPEKTFEPIPSLLKDGRSPGRSENNEQSDNAGKIVKFQPVSKPKRTTIKTAQAQGNVVAILDGEGPLTDEEVETAIASVVRRPENQATLIQAVHAWAKVKQVKATIAVSQKEDEWETAITAEDAALQFEEFLTKHNYNLHLRDH